MSESTRGIGPGDSGDSQGSDNPAFLDESGEGEENRASQYLAWSKPQRIEP